MKGGPGGALKEGPWGGRRGLLRGSRGALEGGLGGWRLLAKGPDEEGDQMSYFTRTVLLRLTAFLHCVLYLFLNCLQSVV